MTDHSLARDCARFTLRRVYPDGTSALVEGTETDDRIAAIETGHRLMREHPGSAFTLFEGTTPRDRFNHRALKLRLSPGAVEMMVS